MLTLRSGAFQFRRIIFKIFQLISLNGHDLERHTLLKKSLTAEKGISEQKP